MADARREIEFLDTFMRLMSKFENPVDILNNVDMNTVVDHAELCEILLSPEHCQLSLENRNNLLHYLVVMPHSRNPANS